MKDNSVFGCRYIGIVIHYNNWNISKIFASRFLFRKLVHDVDCTLEFDLLLGSGLDSTAPT